MSSYKMPSQAEATQFLERRWVVGTFSARLHLYTQIVDH
jgi:hypothetical protein